MPFNRAPKGFEIKGNVAVGNFDSEPMDYAFERCYLGSIKFYNAAGAQVTPGAGTVTFQLSADGVNFQDVPDGAFNAADAYLAGRKMPTAYGPAVKGRIALAGVTGAVYFSALMSRY
jgi:hypothetical protein